jgi:hypothetical protein
MNDPMDRLHFSTAFSFDALRRLGLQARMNELVLDLQSAGSHSENWNNNMVENRLCRRRECGNILQSAVNSFHYYFVALLLR